MAISNYFYNETTRKYVALFGSIFNKITIERNDADGVLVQKMIVPISYGPFQKFMSRIKQDPNLDRKTAISLPRISFEMNNMTYDPLRKVASTNKIRTSGQNQTFMHSPAPYNIDFSMSIMTKYSEDGAQILEQIVPFFKPERTTTVKLIDGIEPLDIPLVLNSISMEDVYEGDFETRRSLLWTLDFTMKCWFFGPKREQKVIKFVDLRHFSSMDATEHESSINIQPGLDTNGQPTNDLEETIPFQNIFEEDDWGVITTYEDD